MQPILKAVMRRPVQGTPLRSNLSRTVSSVIDCAMVMRCLLALFLVLSGIMVATSPVAAMAMSGGMLCAPQTDVVEPVAADKQHAAHAHHHADAADEPMEAEQPLPVCCDHACLSEVSVLPIVSANRQTDYRATFFLSSADRPDLIGRDGLRRPPRA